MTTPRQPKSESSSNPGSPPSFFKQLLNEIGGVSTLTASGNDKTLRNSSRVGTTGNAEKRVPSIWVGGASAARDAREKLRAADEARSRKKNITKAEGIPPSSSLPQHASFKSSQSTVASSGDYYTVSHRHNETCAIPKIEQKTISSDEYVLNADVLPSSQPRLNLQKLKIPLRTVPDEHTQSSSPLTSCGSDQSSDTSSSEAPTSALTASSSNAATALSHFEGRSKASRKRGRSVDDTEDELLLKKMRPLTSPQTRKSATTSNSEPHLTTSPKSSPDKYRLLLPGLKFTGRSLAGAVINTPIEHLPNDANTKSSIAIQSPEPSIIPQPTTPVKLSAWQYTSATPEPPETPSFVRTLHLFDTSVSVYKDDKGDEWMHDISIFKSTHGDGWAQNSLCKHCFSRSGKFSRIMTYGYETCGREECLEDYHWEPAVSPNC
ncbi:hypothetical protein COCCADRAFT_112662 [Bipolaris zeicola 26-R-13]|uniref:Uncharacterized protein n=1 Tax=Cochliobolus carbonum (strain 26-R-13) TaxID=930089 RepID=W6XP78_COCC2|nr:uncharacterized protein COCCADRAFT_112662 [Bipolaris zeicola 26-R-13]EUC27065.1 hypothetical protein COCCADRAFT_112662 [Bipolaris zeicola 26-R-13]